MEYFEHEEIRSVEHLDLFARQVVEGFITGMHKSPYHGFSVEFAEHRQYNPGESTKHIDWKVYARSDKLFTKKYEEETNLRCHIVIDASSSMFYPEPSALDPNEPNKFAFACLSAAALMQLLKRQRDAFGLSVFQEGIINHVRPKNSSAHYARIINELYGYISHPPKEQGTSVVQALHEVADRIHRRSLVMVFSDLMDTEGKLEELYSALQHLRFSQHDVLLMHVQHAPTEQAFEFDNRPYEFIDAETGERVKLQANEVRDQYVSLKAARDREIAQTCQRFKMDYHPADITQGYVQVLRTLLAKRSKMAKR